jgi:hypothetical protein
VCQDACVLCGNHTNIHHRPKNKIPIEFSLTQTRGEHEN